MAALAQSVWAWMVASGIEVVSAPSTPSVKPAGEADHSVAANTRSGIPTLAATFMGSSRTLIVYTEAMTHQALLRRGDDQALVLPVVVRPSQAIGTIGLQQISRAAIRPDDCGGGGGSGYRRVTTSWAVAEISDIPEATSRGVNWGDEPICPFPTCPPEPPPKLNTSPVVVRA